MTFSIKQIESLLNRNQIGLVELFSLRRELGVPFKMHPLGFIACTLLIEGPRKLRLHYWPVTGGAQQSAECQIHDHLFEFRSWILAGAVTNVEYKISRNGPEFSTYRTEYSDERSILVKTDLKLRLEECSRVTYNIGSSYDVRTGVLHETVRVGGQPACTVLLTHDVSDSAPLVLGPLSGSARYIYERRAIEESVLAQILPSALVPD